jgi:uncharacterized repeat protein (TIGR01451 family)
VNSLNGQGSGSFVGQSVIVTYTIIVTNLGSYPVPLMDIVDAVPAGTIYLGADPPPSSGPDPLVWSFGPFAPNEVWVGHVYVSVTAVSGAITNTAYANGFGSNQVINILPPTSISLVSLRATARLGGVEVAWETASEQNALGFRIYRSVTPARESAGLVTTGLIAAQGAQSGARYRWLDANPPTGGPVYYCLQEQEISGSTSEYGPATARWPVYAAYLPSVMR